MPAWYEVAAQQDDNGTWLLTMPDFPELATFGRNKSKAYASLTRGLYYAVGLCFDRATDVPLPNEGQVTVVNHVDVPALLLLKLRLYQTMRDQKVSIPALAGRLRTQEDRVFRLLRVEHNSQIDLLVDALREVGMSVSIEIRPTR